MLFIPPWASQHKNHEKSMRFRSFDLRKRTFFAVTCIVYALGAGAAAQTAQASPDGVDATQQRQQDERLLQLRKRLEPQVDIRAPSPTPLATQTLPTSESPCFVLDAVRLTTAGQEPSEPNPWSEPRIQRKFIWLLDAMNYPSGSGSKDSPIGKCVGVEGVAILSRRAQEALIAHGFVTSRAVIEPQNLAKGTLTLTVIPGWVNDVRFKTPPGVRPTSTTLAGAAPMQSGHILNLRDIEQALENFKRVPSADADIQIEPGTSANAGPDQSDIVVRFSQEHYARLNLTVDDGASKSSGPYQGTATLSLDNMLALNDTMYVTLSHDLGGANAGPPGLDSDSGRNGTQGHTLHYSMPWGYWAVSGTTSRSRYFQTVAGLSTNYVYSGVSTSSEFGVSRMLRRSATGKTSAGLKGWQRTSNNYIDDLEVEVQRRVVGGWDLSVNHKDTVGNASFGTALAYKRATHDFGTIAAPEEEFGGGTSKFGLIAWDFNASVPFQLPSAKGPRKLRWDVVARGQNNTTPLLSQDRFSIGGRYTVRGFDGDSVLSAERGWLLRNDLSLALGDTGPEIYLGIDHGEVSGPATAELLGSRLAGAVIGLRGSSGGVSYDIFVGGPMDRPSGFHTARTCAGFSLSISF